ncbi:hypothetical protein ASG52_08780 [Methylobacterium sp. Leaf456]|uniref:hypothetical protein n=1 Tax=Methylobacterium sp. Leaf456 TaxID=1736382 RepID=UPI0006F804E7|nr:hypothetical protein [Methylobacterium sp. Leaf456]KQT49063.1 hypothetical protein ASG52_08780 [Methylobacterium sp. Leaf456]
MLKLIGAAIARALAAMKRIALVPVIEGGRLVWRAVQALAPHDPIAEAEAAIEAQAAEPAPAPVALSPAEQWGRASVAYLMGEEREAADLDDAARFYLDHLSLDQQVALSQNDAIVIGRHLLGERLLPSLPRPMTPAEYRSMEAARAAAAAAAAHHRLTGDENKRRHFVAVLDELIAEPPRAA